MNVGVRDDWAWANDRPEGERPALHAKAEPFDFLVTPADPDVGVLAEVFRTWPRTQVSDHPDARFVACGPLAGRRGPRYQRTHRSRRFGRVRGGLDGRAPHDTIDAIDAIDAIDTMTAGDAAPMFLETNRLILRRFTEADVDLLVELDSDPDVMRFVTGGIATPRHEVVAEVMPAFPGYTSGSRDTDSGP